VTIADLDACVHLLGEVDGAVRDALHVAVMRNNDLETIATYGAGFDAFGVQRYSLG
jgi:predicted nucleic acid-binding protein